MDPPGHDLPVDFSVVKLGWIRGGLFTVESEEIRRTLGGNSQNYMGKVMKSVKSFNSYRVIYIIDPKKCRSSSINSIYSIYVMWCTSNWKVDLLHKGIMDRSYIISLYVQRSFEEVFEPLNISVLVRLLGFQTPILTRYDWRILDV